MPEGPSCLSSGPELEVLTTQNVNMGWILQVLNNQPILSLFWKPAHLAAIDDNVERVARQGVHKEPSTRVTVA